MEEKKKQDLLIRDFMRLEEGRKNHIQELVRKLTDIHCGKKDTGDCGGNSSGMQAESRDRDPDSDFRRIIMKHVVLVLAFFMCFAVLDVPCQQPHSPSTVPAERMIVTWEIVTILQKAKKYNPAIDIAKLEFFLTNSFTLKAEKNEIKIAIDGNGTLEINKQDFSAKMIKFSPLRKGVYKYFNDTPGGEFFVIDFNSEDNESYPLTFKINKQKNCFEIVSLVIDKMEYVIPAGGERVQLVINCKEILESIKVHAVLPSVSANSAHRWSDTSIQQPPAGKHPGVSHYQPSPVSYPSRSTFIEGQGSLTKAGVIAYILSQNPAANRQETEQLIDTYFREAEVERINHDIAIAQMLHATNFLKNRQRVSTNNYAGYDSNYRFENMPVGVRVHIQHLKGYASTARLNGHPVDPRFTLLNDLGYRGRVTKFEELYGYWAPNSNYGIFINEILQGLYRYSGR